MKKVIFAVAILFSSEDVAFALCIPVSESCSYCTTYTCNTGYYGTATGVGVGCAPCPANATCPGGTNPSTYTCNAGYYLSGTECVSCATATGNSSATSPSGSDDITDCYLPVGYEGEDDYGYWDVYGSVCNYELAN